MRKTWLAAAFGGASLPCAVASDADQASQLRTPAAFVSIADERARSAAPVRAAVRWLARNSGSGN
jgi:hypothetical protein